MHSFFAKKIAKKVIRDTLQSIISLKKCHRWTLFRLSSVLSHTDSTEDTNVEPTSALLFESFKNTNSSNLTNVEPNSALLFEFF